jgi:tRNA modification GTPase
MFQSSRNRDIVPSRQRIFHGYILDAEGQPVDEVLLHLMRAPHSYTMEDVVEINAHGGMAPLRAILETALKHGARLAQPGEFTRRAFLNGRIDLSRAEAVIDLIQAKTQTALKAANAAAGGMLTQALHELHLTLADALAHIEAAVDFPEEDLPELVTPALLERLREAHERMMGLEQSADAGMLYQQGAAAVIVGRPNVGKSSLFNTLLRDARAIVSEHPGTTRDRIEAIVNIQGIPVRLMDTAGLHATQDAVEAIGVERAYDAARQASLLLFVVDISVAPDADTCQLAEELRSQNTPILLVRNKCDLVDAIRWQESVPECLGSFDKTCSVSAAAPTGIEEMEQCMAELLLNDRTADMNSPMLFRAHQKDSMNRAAASLGVLLENPTASPEFLAVDLRDALRHLGEITGETTPEDVLDRIFSAFCIGK